MCIYGKDGMSRRLLDQAALDFINYYFLSSSSFKTKTISRKAKWVKRWYENMTLIHSCNALNNHQSMACLGGCTCLRCFRPSYVIGHDSNVFYFALYDSCRISRTFSSWPRAMERRHVTPHERARQICTLVDIRRCFVIRNLYFKVTKCCAFTGKMWWATDD